jgi:membrane protein implicated in regulation of membrane protease activity
MVYLITMDQGNSANQEPVGYLPPPEEQAPDLSAEQRRVTIIIIAVAVALLLIIIISFVLLMNANPVAVAQLRDVFIIFLALQSLLIGVVLTILIIQLARLINLLQNEIKPILESTNDTVNNLRGTTTFLSDNLVEPVIKMNEYLAGLTKFFVVMGMARKKKKDNSQ